MIVNGEENYTIFHPSDSGRHSNLSVVNRNSFFKLHCLISRCNNGHRGASQLDSKCLFTIRGKKSSVDEKRNNVYENLRDSIFIPLRDKRLVIEDRNYPEDDLKIFYDNSNLKQLPDYDEAKMHMNQDLEDITAPDILEAEARQHNEEVDDFVNKQIPEIVERLLRSKIQNIKIINTDDEPPEHTISLSSLLPSLKRRWIDGTNFSCRTKADGYTWINNAMVARVSPMQRSNLESAISDLKNHYEIQTKVNMLNNKREVILGLGKTLSKAIDKKIVSQINYKRYKTVCEYCNKV
jgi:hypothetical protein